MKNRSKYIVLIILILVILICVVKYQKTSLGISDDHLSLQETIPGRVLGKDQYEPTNKKHNASEIGQAFAKLAEEMTRSICKEEGNAFNNFFMVAIEPKVGEEIPQDKFFIESITPSQAIEWLKRTATSKCSSFIKTNATRLFFDFKLDENNYAQFYKEYNRHLETFNASRTAVLIQKSLNAMDKAIPEEKKALREAILFSLATQINDSADWLAIHFALSAVKECRDKGLISYPTSLQIDASELLAPKGFELPKLSREA